jgi:hypothetical protein
LLKHFYDGFCKVFVRWFQHLIHVNTGVSFLLSLKLWFSWFWV